MAEAGDAEVGGEGLDGRGVGGRDLFERRARPSASTGFNSYVIASVLAAKSQSGQSAKVSSPAPAGARNSSDFEPPMAPAVAAQMR